MLRNLWITQGYRDIALGLAAILGSTNNTWCSFGTWASNSVGTFIRMDHLPEVLRELLAHDGDYGAAALGIENDPPMPYPLVVRAMEHTEIRTLLDTLATHVRDAMAHGNCLVFAEIGMLFAGFVDAFADGSKPFSAMNPILDEIAGPDNDGAERLRDSARAYYEAMSESDPLARAQWVLYGNLLAGWQEQVRLEPDLLAAVNAPLDGLATRLSGVVAYQAIARELDHLWDEVGTKHVMTLDLPGISLRLGQPVPLPSGTILDPVTLEPLQRLLERLDPGGLGASAARDWTALGDRMRFIAALFRAHAHDPALMATAPFTADQLSAMMVGRVPAGI